jgi:hypothetical protein
MANTLPTLSPSAIDALLDRPIRPSGAFCSAFAELDRAGLFLFDACELTPAGEALKAELLASVEAV